jgi:tRNA(His) 5'-end guanylyltransferase
MSKDPVTDPLGDRMKGYEGFWKIRLPAKSFSVIRLDGRSFHTWTRGLTRPYDPDLIEAMGAAALAVAEDVSGAVLAYTQSDEISVVFSDLASEETEAWFGGQVQKIVSVAASLATGSFARSFPERRLAQFDARVFALPDATEVCNYLRWRQADARRNAISMLASDRFSAKQLHGASTADRRDLLAQAGVHIDAADPRFLHGQLLHKATRTGRIEYTDRRTKQLCLSEPVIRRVWQSIPAPDLTAAPDGIAATLLAGNLPVADDQPAEVAA